MGSVQIEKFIQKFNALTEKPVNYLTVQKELKDDIKELIKSLYDYTKCEEKGIKAKKNQALSEIIVNDFDEEQIWQQIELQNSECFDQFSWDVANCISSKTNLVFPIKFPEEHPSEQNADPNLSDDGSVMSDSYEEINKQEQKVKNFKSKTKSSIVDDKFFKLQDMEKFLLNEEKMEEKVKRGKSEEDDDDSINLFEDIDDDESEEGGKELMYQDFFNDDVDQYDDEDNELEVIREVSEREENMKENVRNSDKDKKVRFLEPDSRSESDDTESEEETQPISNGNSGKEERKSEFQLRQERLKQQISRLEERTLKEAPWQLKGEVDAKKRPENSLLQEVLDFELTSRPPPIITEQTTITLEGLIKQRVKDKSWDDVVRKEKPVDDQLDFKKSVILDQSKSEMSLAQIYEAEYLKRKHIQLGEVEEAEPESHKEIKEAMNKLFSKLDALTHYHYTPKPPQAEVKIVSNIPAISMEEVAPVATSDAALLAPEEVKRKQKGDLMSKDERTKTDKNRERRKKKKLQRKKGKIAKVTEHRNTKEGVEVNDKSLKTSKAFFQQLHDESSSLIKKTKLKKNISK